MTALGDLTMLAPPQSAGAAHTLKLAGEFDLSNSSDLEQTLWDAIEAGGRDFIIDLREVTFMDGTALNVLMLASKRCARRNGRLILVRPPSSVWRVFVLTGMSRAFAAFGSYDEAERHLRRV